MEPAVFVYYWVISQVASITCVLGMYLVVSHPACATFMFKLLPIPTARHVCAICLDESPAQPQWITGCGHIYHRSCLFQWLQQQTNCPECRRDLRWLYWRWAVYQACVFTCRALEQYGNRRYVP